MIRLTEDSMLFNSIVPAVRGAGTVNGTAVDTSLYQPDEVVATLPIGAIVATGTLDAKVQESDDNSTWSDVAGAAIVQVTDAGASPASPPSISVRWGGRAAGTRKKWVRGVGIVATANVTYALQLILKGCQQMPTVNTPASIVV